MSEVFASADRGACYERALVLTAVGLEATVRVDAVHGFVLEVPEAHRERAHLELARYEAENVRPPPPPPPAPDMPRAGIGAGLYALMLMIVALALAAGWVRLDAFETGDLDAGAVRAGQWWRAITALTLHLDAQHLAANLAAGAWFGWLAGRQLGPGVAWLLIVWGAGLANLGEALLAPEGYRSAGASTAVFTALGLLSAYSWRERWDRAQRWGRRWAPLVAGVVLLGWTGSGGGDLQQHDRETDVFAHLAGFTVGVVLGVVAGAPRPRARLRRLSQPLAGLAALALVALAWSFALGSRSS